MSIHLSPLLFQTGSPWQAAPSLQLLGDNRGTNARLKESNCSTFLLFLFYSEDCCIFIRSWWRNTHTHARTHMHARTHTSQEWWLQENKIGARRHFAKVSSTFCRWSTQPYELHYRSSGKRNPALGRPHYSELHSWHQQPHWHNTVAH